MIISDLPLVHILIVFYILTGQTYLVNTFLMPCLEKISKKFKFSETGTGILVALGISIPELTTNLISSYSFKRETIGYGFGAIVGSGAFDFTICFGCMSLFSHHYHKKAIKLKMKALLRDIYAYLLTVVYLAFVFWDYQISLTESFILTIMYPAYLLYSLNDQNQEDDFDSSLEHQQHHMANQIQMHEQIKHSKVIKEEDLEGEQIGMEKKQDKIQEENEEDEQPQFWLLPFDYLFKYTLPSEKPELCFAIISFYCFLMVKFTIETVDEVVEVIQVGHAFVGLTVASWAGNVGDILNASVAAKNKKTELATSSIIGSQIMNLQICLGLPWMLAILLHQQNIVFYDATIFISIMAILTVVIGSLLLMIYFRLELSYQLGTSLLLLYCGYFIFELKNNKL